ncbi:MerR family transcriptional regulator [Brevundimonas lenta]|uniref:DNA-binding transcriptional MerR regulator n=1 Tax=Brevundimonas lenta TaxID=424796 RepID=A0A7W6JBE0_9CAUL|nr:DNA-binding transcriptional MerR regulator [Brevundimonas lenta]
MASCGPVHAVVSISRLAEITGVTPRALRHYEDVGLIRPLRSAAGVRLFTPDQCELASRIVLLRRCDLSLDEIRDVLAGAPSEDDRATRLRDVLERKAADLSRTLEVVNAALAGNSPVETQDRRQAA